MSDDVLVRVEGVSKKFCRSLKRSLWYGVRDTAADLLGRGHGAAGLRPEEFWAVDDVSFELKRGECLGLIGRNGAGKTTLLKMLNGLIKPDRGRIEMRGRVGALIALGAGFNPILTGRENIYVNGAVLGLSKREIDERIDDIIDFAEINEFIDSPVQSYSSGMQVRLGFAIATAMELDVLLVDEVLSVGDRLFQAKCHNRLRSIRRSCATIVVSHNESDIRRLCDSALWLRSGSAMLFADVHETYKQYREYDSVQFRVGFAAPGFDLQIPEKDRKQKVYFGDPLEINFIVESPKKVSVTELRISIEDETLQCVAEWRSLNHKQVYQLIVGTNAIKIHLDKITLRSGLYFCNVVLSTEIEEEYTLLKRHEIVLEVTGAIGTFATCQL